MFFTLFKYFHLDSFLYKFVSMPRSFPMVELRSMLEFTFEIVLKQNIKIMKQNEQCYMAYDYISNCL
jgi:hypothetical protein